MRVGGVEIALIEIITFIGILITFLTGVLNLFQNKKSLYINNITKYRMIWITTLRTHIANLKELSNLTNLYIITKEGADKITYRRELDRNTSLIKMHLNFTGRLDAELMCKVDELKSIINSYLLMYYCINTINAVDNDNDLVTKFNDVIGRICEKKVIEELLNLAINNKKIEMADEIRKLDLVNLKNKVKEIYKDDYSLIREIVRQSDCIINGWENKIEELGRDIDEIVQIYLKAEWIRCKIETRMWIFSQYNEEKVIDKLKLEYKDIKQKYFDKV
jgi:hypothetical protein